MKSFIRKPGFSISTLVALSAIAFIIYATCSAADSKRPERGSIQFGAKEPPKIASSHQLDAFKTIVADVAEKVVPTVVSVIPTKIDTVTFSNNPFYQFFGQPFGSPFDDFFGNQEQPRQHRQQMRPQIEKRQGLGSGVIVSPDGYILTNYHVVAGANEIEVKTTTGRDFQASVVGVDSLADVAVIKINEKVKDLPVAYIGDSDKLRPGDWAIAIGNPFSLTSSVTMGIISALGRQTPESNGAKYQSYIQTDAAINPGNSGGALVNINGELIGINTLIYTQSGGFMGIGFAIPINMARSIMEDLIYEGKVTRGWLGVTIQQLDQPTRDALNLPENSKGVLVGEVFKGQPAEKAGMKRGDIIVSINGKEIGDPNELRNYVATLRPGAKVPVEVLRDRKKMTFEVKLTTREGNTPERLTGGENESSNSSSGDFAERIGIKVGAITAEVRKELNLDDDISGVIILDVDQSSIAADEGIRQNDIILEVNQQKVGSLKDFRQVTKSLKKGDTVLFLFQRDNDTYYKAFKMTR